MQLHQVITGMRTVIWRAITWAAVAAMLVSLGLLVGLLAGCAAAPVGYDMY